MFHFSQWKEREREDHAAVRLHAIGKAVSVAGGGD